MEMPISLPCSVVLVSLVVSSEVAGVAAVSLVLTASSAGLSGVDPQALNTSAAKRVINIKNSFVFFIFSSLSLFVIEV